MNKAIKQYKLIDGRSVETKEFEKFIRRIVKLSGNKGWKYTLNSGKGKRFCVTQASTNHPKGKVTEESVTIEFTWTL